MQLIDVSPAASEALTNSTTETVLKSHLFPAGFWQVGKVVKARCCVRATATNGTDTLAILPRLGAAALTGTSLGGQAALDVANDDICVLDIELVCRSDENVERFMSMATGRKSDPNESQIDAVRREWASKPR